MAKPKKKSPSKSKKHTKKASKPAHKSASKRGPSAGLTIDDKQRLLKPGPDYDAVLADTIPAWKANGRYLKMPELTAASLASDGRKAARAWEKERAFRAKMDAKLQPLMDARMRAEDRLMRGMLDLNAEVKSSARRRPELTALFQSLADFCARGGRSSGGGSDSGPATPTT